MTTETDNRIVAARRITAQIADLLRELATLGIGFKDLQTEQSSLEDIFVNLVHQPAMNPA